MRSCPPSPIVLQHVLKINDESHEQRVGILHKVEVFVTGCNIAECRSEQLFPRPWHWDGNCQLQSSCFITHLYGTMLAPSGQVRGCVAEMLHNSLMIIIMQEGNDSAVTKGIRCPYLYMTMLFTFCPPEMGFFVPAGPA